MKQILRVQKLKTLISLRRSIKHAFRTQNTPNADSSKSNLNQFFGATNETDAIGKIKALLPEKLRKNGVVCVEYLITASSHFFDGKNVDEANQYFNDSIGWLRKKWGAENVVFGGVHRDETTPHLYVYIVPKDRDTGRLNCRKWLGERDSLSHMQTQFHDDVSSKYGLERGLKGSKAKHQTLKKYYAKINQIESSGHQNMTKKSALLGLIGLNDSYEKMVDKLMASNVLFHELNELKESFNQERQKMKSLIDKSEGENQQLKEQMDNIKSADAWLRERISELETKGRDRDGLVVELNALKSDFREVEVEKTSLINYINSQIQKTDDDFYQTDEVEKNNFMDYQL